MEFRDYYGKARRKVRRRILIPVRPPTTKYMFKSFNKDNGIERDKKNRNTYFVHF